MPRDRWMSTPSLRTTYQLMSGRMYPLTLDGLDEAMAVLRKGGPRIGEALAACRT